jgi:hypothetical protein
MFELMEVSAKAGFCETLDSTTDVLKRVTSRSLIFSDIAATLLGVSHSSILKVTVPKRLAANERWSLLVELSTTRMWELESPPSEYCELFVECLLPG